MSNVNPINKSLLPPNATALERTIESASERAANLPVPMRTLWNPDTCPAHLLPYLAWALSMDNWKPYWSEAIKRQQIRKAIAVQRTKGTAFAVKTAVEAFGASVSVTEWWEKSPKGTPHTFELAMVSGGEAAGNAALQQDIVNEINRVKPVRAHFVLNAGLSATGSIALFGAARPVVYRRLHTTEG